MPTYPDGVIVRNVVLPPIVDAGGSLTSGVITISPSIALKWAATGQIVLADPVSVPIVDGTATFSLPIVQSGFVLTSNLLVDAWTYVATIQVPGRTDLSEVTFILPSGDGDYALQLEAPTEILATVVRTLEYVGVPSPVTELATEAALEAQAAAEAAAESAAAAEAVGTTNDAIMAGVVADPGSDTYTALQPVVAEQAATEMANPESPLNSATVTVVEEVLGGGVEGLIYDFDGSLTDIHAARPAVSGRVRWSVWMDEPAIPTNLISGDRIAKVEVEPVPWTPAMLPNLAGWFDAQTLGLSDGAAVSSWQNLKAGGNPAVQATGANQPLYDVDKIAGTHAAVVADGSNDRLAFAVTAYTGPITVYIVGGTDLADNASGSDFLLSAKDSASAVGRCDIYRTAGEAYTVQRVGTMASAAAAWTTGVKTMVVVTNGASSSLTVDGSSVATGNVSNGAEVAEWSLFSRSDAANFFPGYIGELVIVHGTVSTDDNTAMLAYLAARWA